MGEIYCAGVKCTEFIKRRMPVSKFGASWAVLQAENAKIKSRFFCLK